MPQVEDKLKELGIELYPPTESKGPANLVSVIQTGNLLFVGGHPPRKPDGSIILGKVGGDLTFEEGYEAGKWAAVTLLSSVKNAIGDLDKINRIVKVLAMFNVDPNFTQISEIANGCTDLFEKIWGPERGLPTRSAVGMASMPRGFSCEIEMTAELK